MTLRMGGQREQAPVVAAREITDDEVAFYDEHGWVKLNGLITPEMAAHLLAMTRELQSTVEHNPDPGKPEAHAMGRANEGFFKKIVETPDWRATWWGEMFSIWDIKLDPFFGFSHGTSLGRAAYRLMNFEKFTDKQMRVRYSGDVLQCKNPVGEKSTEVGYHQDYGFGEKQVGFFNIWIALEELSGEQGTMQFFDKSHRAGPLGPASVLERYPKFPEHYELTPGLQYKPGDATVHHALTVHGSPENTTDKTRWAFICGFRPEDCKNQNGDPADWETRHPIVYP